MSKQKTPLGELLEYYIKMSESLGIFHKVTTREIIDKLQSSLHKEREAIINAYETGDKYKFETPGEKYFKETFEQ